MSDTQTIKPASKKFWLHFPKETVTRPIIWELYKFMAADGHDFCFNIRQATVHGETGLMAVELIGDINTAVSFLLEQGVRVEPIENDVVE